MFLPCFTALTLPYIFRSVILPVVYTVPITARACDRPPVITARACDRPRDHSPGAISPCDRTPAIAIQANHANHAIRAGD